MPQHTAACARFARIAVLPGLIVAALSQQTASSQPSDFRNLFDGITLNGWEGDFNSFRAEDGAIVGGTLDAPIPSNAFLCTIDEFADFELRLEARLRGEGDNAGVQFRSRRLPGHHEVSGYQADMGTVSSSWFNSVIGRETATEEGAKSPVWGSLYDEARRNRYIAWALPELVSPVLSGEGWNELRVRAEQRRIRIWVNGVQTVDYLEREHIPASGNICLQIHGGAPAEAWHRNVRIRELPGGAVAFRRARLGEPFFAEGANFGDLNGDGANDLVSGPFWFAGPDFEHRFEYYEPVPFDPARYSDNFFAHVVDFDRDGWNDILIIGFPGQAARWYRNPGRASGDSGRISAAETTSRWQVHNVVDVVDNESPWWTDLTGDGKPEIIFIHGGRYGYAGPNWESPGEPWVFHPISEDGGWQRFTHGLGVGDLDGDGRADILERAGWWKQPSTLEGDPVWERHDFEFSERGGAQMLVFDVDGDGDSDVVASDAAHGYGLSWFENTGADSRGGIRLEKRRIMGDNPLDNPYGVAFAELHALALADVDGDGVDDVVTGKRWWSHGAEGDPDMNSRAWLYWFRVVRDAPSEGGVEFVPHLIDDDTGVGVQVVAGDVNSDSLPDVVVGNKKGVTILTQERR